MFEPSEVETTTQVLAVTLRRTPGARRAGRASVSLPPGWQRGALFRHRPRSGTAANLDRPVNAAQPSPHGAASEDAGR
jgi:hypothetical protein